jgi:hypothetical protein
MERRIAQNKKSDQEKRMRELATKAREERTHAVRKAAADEEEGGEVAEEALEREAIRRE